MIFLLLAGASQRAAAQGLSASAPTKEFLYLGGRLVAIEERGSGTQANVVGTTHNPASATTAAASPRGGSPASSPSPAPPVAMTQQPLPALGVPPQDTSGSAARLPVVTPASTHTATPPLTH